MKTIPELIKAIEVHQNLSENCKGCPYDEPRRGKCVDKLLNDILSLLTSITQQYEDDLK